MSSHPQPSSPAYHDRDQQQHPIVPKRFDGFFSQNQTPSDSQPAFHALLGAQQQPTYQFTSTFTDDELLESLIHRQSINSPQQQQPHHHHHQAIPITATAAPTSSDTERRGSFSSSAYMEDCHTLLSPSSSAHPTHFSHSPSRLSQLSAAHPTLRQSRSPQPKPLGNRHPASMMYPFSPPTSITTTLVDEERSPAVSTISVNDSITLSSSQPTRSSFCHSITSPDDSAILRSPIDPISSNELSLSSSLPTRRTFSPHAIVDHQKLALNEKIRKRRESHNAVERRRRDNINDRITELAGLLPQCLLDPVVTPSESGMMMVVSEEPCPTEDSQTLNYTHNKPNKGVILAKSVDYIKHLKHLLELQSQRNLELEAELSRVRSNKSNQHHEHEETSKLAREEEADTQRKGAEDSTSDQIHEWIKMHDQQNPPNSKSNEENTFMMTTETLPYRADQETGDPHHPSDPDSASVHPQTLSVSEAFKSNQHHPRFLSSTHDHFPSHFHHHLTGFESIYHHLQ